MKIIINTEIREKWHSGFDREKPPTTIVIHGTGGGSSSAALINWMLDGERGEEYKKGIALFHYLIDAEGLITEIIDPHKWVYAASCGSKDKVNINVELLNGTNNNSGNYTAAQYTALVDLIKKCYEDFKTVNITTHNYMGTVYSGKPKKCPGDGFSFAIFQDYLKRYFNFAAVHKDYFR